jgi:hypothetical protein
MPYSLPERRKNLRLRALFDEIYACAEPSIECRPCGLPMEWLAFRAARAACPQLKPLDLFQFAMAARRVYCSRHDSSSLGLTG